MRLPIAGPLAIPAKLFGVEIARALRELTSVLAEAAKSF
jgi:hypothetical protein